MSFPLKVMLVKCKCKKFSRVRSKNQRHAICREPNGKNRTVRGRTPTSLKMFKLVYKNQRNWNYNA